jgi:hypothetical protein
MYLSWSKYTANTADITMSRQISSVWYLLQNVVRKSVANARVSRERKYMIGAKRKDRISDDRYIGSLNNNVDE